MVRRVRALAILLAVLVLSGCSVFRDAADTETGLQQKVSDESSVIASSENVSESKAEEPEITDPFEGVSITFAAAGDNLIHPNIYMEAESRAVGDEGYDFTPVYAEIADIISSADISFINQETLMAGEEFGLLRFITNNDVSRPDVERVCDVFEKILKESEKTNPV